MNSCSLTSDPLAPAEPARSVFVDHSDDRPCFLHRGQWNEGLDGFQPWCGSREPASVPAWGVRRVGLTYVT